MADLNIIATNLQQMRQQLMPFMDAVMKGAPEEVRERNLRLAEMERILERLRIIIRDLRSEEHLVQAIEENLGNTPRANRWQAIQSLNQRQKNLQNTKKQAMDLAEVVRQLMDKNGLLSGLQMGMKLKDLIENMEKSAEQGHAIQQIMSELGMPAITMPQTEVPTASSLMPALIFVIYGIRRIMAKDKRTSSAAAD
jgi:tRNA nucleotidyltransferase/poly(A) polymerase